MTRSKGQRICSFDFEVGPPSDRQVVQVRADSFTKAKALAAKQFEAPVHQPKKHAKYYRVPDDPKRAMFKAAFR